MDGAPAKSKRKSARLTGVNKPDPREIEQVHAILRFCEPREPDVIGQEPGRVVGLPSKGQVPPAQHGLVAQPGLAPLGEIADSIQGMPGGVRDTNNNKARTCRDISGILA